jgi:hypothetical protein
VKQERDQAKQSNIAYQHENERCRRESDKREEDNIEWRRQNEGLRDRIDLLKEQIQAKELEAQKSRLQSNKLRQMLKSRDNDDSEPLDAKVVQEFRELRDLTQKIVHKYCTVKTYRVTWGTKLKEVAEKRRAYFEDWDTRLPESVRRLRVRATIFDFIFGEILSQPCFGIQRQEMEDAFIDFEISMDQG